MTIFAITVLAAVVSVAYALYLGTLIRSDGHGSRAASGLRTPPRSHPADAFESHRILQ